MPLLFYGPGGGEYEDWQAFQMHYNVDQALRLGVSEKVIRDRLILQIGQRGRLNFNGLTRAYAERQVKRRIKAYTLLATLSYGIPFVTRQIAMRRTLHYYKAPVSPLTKIGAKETAETLIYRTLMRRAPTRLLSRFVPYLGWGLAGYDIYTILFKGQLWGVQVYEKA